MSSANDMAKWMAMHLNGGMAGGQRLISDAAQRVMWTPHTSSTTDPNPAVPAASLATSMRLPVHFRGYGLGFSLSDYRGRFVAEHGAMILGAHITNYTRAAADGGIILHTSVTIGYDTPWRQVHELLLAAASRTDGLLREPAPYVLQKALNDFHVGYEVNAYSEQAGRMPQIYSELHQNIQDDFQRAGVQIMSPNYEADPAEPKIPPTYVPSGNPKLS